MASTLKNIIQFVAVGSGLQSTLPHLLNIENVGIVPDKVSVDDSDFDVITVTATNVTVRNNSGAAASVNVLCESWHSTNRDFVAPLQPALTPQPFIEDATAGGGGAGGGNVIVFQPGGVAIGNIYTTWADVMTALGGMTGPVDLYFDDQFVSPCVIPAGGPYDMTNVLWRGARQEGVAAQVTIADGATFIKLLDFSNIVVESLSTAAVCELENGDRITIHDFSDVSCSGGATFWSGATLGAFEYAVLDLYNYGSIGVYGAANAVVVDMSAAVADYLYVQIGERSMVFFDAIACNAAGTVNILSNSTSAFYMKTTTLLGTVVLERRAYPQYNMRPSRGVAPGVANVGGGQIGDWIRVNAAAGSFTQDMPRIIHGEWTDGRTCIVTETSGVNGVTLQRRDADTIEGALTYWLPAGATAIFISDGVSNWRLLAINRNFLLNQTNVFTKAQGSAKVTLVDAATIATDAEAGNVFEVTLAGNRALGLPTNLVSGFTYMWIINQSAGGNTIACNAIFKFPGGVAPVLSAAAGAVDVITAVYNGTILASVFQADFR